MSIFNIQQFNNTPVTVFEEKRDMRILVTWLVSTRVRVVEFSHVLNKVRPIHGVVGLLTKLRKVYCRVWVKTFLKSVNIWQSYKQQRDCLAHFLRLLAVCWPSAHVHETLGDADLERLVRGWQREAPGVDSRDEGRHAERNDLLFVEKMMWMDERVWPKMKSECCEEAELWWGYADIKGWVVVRTL